MSLQAYRNKRNLDRTPEPSGGRPAGQGPLRFVVQKHQASHLHYDFRLELEGVLKSWAVPKGPSLRPEDKRLAMRVEDHPFDYRTFEGTIPQGEYGGGTVMVWDEGTYHPPGILDRKEAEKALRAGLERGHLSFVLEGQKLRGEFSLVRIKKGKGDPWLLIKKQDDYASSSDVTEEALSATTGRTLEEITQGKTARKKAGKARQTAPSRKASKSQSSSTGTASMPQKVKPMLATLVEEPFDRADWLFEVKWDGYRAIAEVKNGKAHLYSRNNKSFDQRFSPLVDSLSELGHDAILDGEVVILDEEGKSSFQLLQNYQKTGQGILRYYVFDLLHLDGQDLRSLPLRERKAMLAKILAGFSDVLLSEHVEEQGKAFFEAAAASGLEGIIAKDGDSPYREGSRGVEWLKIKTKRRQEAVICGFTEPRGSRKQLGALVLGVYSGKELVYIGHTGGGFDSKGLEEMRSRLDPLIQRACPFGNKPKTNAPVHWVEPQLVCEVSFQEWTEDGIMRQPIFVGLREDKPATQVRREEPEPLGKALPASSKKRPPHRSKPKAKASQNGTSAAAERQAPGAPALTHLDKVYWPKEGYTKGDLVAYYREMAPVLLPYLRDRPQSLHRHTNGIDKPSFFQKDVSRQPPPAWVQTVRIASESNGKDIRFLLCQDEATLLYLANLGCIELNPWTSRVGSLDQPDFLIIDLDPEAVPFAKVIEAAQAVHKLLDRAGAECLCKTSGKRGLHLVVPLGGKVDYDQARQFAEIVANLVHQQLPETTSVVRSPAQRQGRVYLDYLQNSRGQTLAAPYSARPVPGATVSTPLTWSEVRKSLDPARFTIKTLPMRLEAKGDLWEPVLQMGIDIQECLDRLASKLNRRTQRNE